MIVQKVVTGGYIQKRLWLKFGGDMKIIAIDPGNTESGFVVWNDGILDKGKIDNQTLRCNLKYKYNIAYDDYILLVEMIASYGMPVGKEVFETCVWIGRFTEIWADKGRSHDLIYRKDVKIHLCGNMRAKDANIRQALIDKLGPVSTKKIHNPIYNDIKDKMKSDIWSALALAITYQELDK